MKYYCFDLFSKFFLFQLLFWEILEKKCNASASTVRRIQKEKPEEPLTEVRPRKFQLDDSDLCVLRRTVQTMYEKHQVLPTLENIRKGLPEAISLTDSKNVLSSALKRIGFWYRHCTTNRKFLWED